MHDPDARSVTRAAEHSANEGHGHVRPRPDGVRARCGGPGICSACSHEQWAIGGSEAVIVPQAPGVSGTGAGWPPQMKAEAYLARVRARELIQIREIVDEALNWDDPADARTALTRIKEITG